MSAVTPPRLTDRPRAAEDGAMPPDTIRLDRVSFAYNGGETVLEDVDLGVGQGAFLAIVGPNGGGKTTLVKLMLGMLRPTAGTVRVLGLDPAQAAPNVGYVPQHTVFEPSFPITVLDVVLLGLVRAHGRPGLGLPRRDRDKALDALRLVDMDAHAARRFDTLSGGQRQRVLVARALVSEPGLLIFDEPTANIDPHGKICLFEILGGLSRSITVVMVSHDLISATAGITDVAVVNRRLIQSEEGREITPDMLELVYGVHGAHCPLDGYMQSLSSLVRSVGHRHDHGGRP